VAFGAKGCHSGPKASGNKGVGAGIELSSSLRSQAVASGSFNVQGFRQAFGGIVGRVPTDAQVRGHVLDRHIPRQFERVPLKRMRVAPTRIGEGHAHLAGPPKFEPFAWQRIRVKTYFQVSRRGCLQTREDTPFGQDISAGNGSDAHAVLAAR